MAAAHAHAPELAHADESQGDEYLDSFESFGFGASLHPLIHRFGSRDEIAGLLVSKVGLRSPASETIAAVFPRESLIYRGFSAGTGVVRSRTGELYSCV